MSARFVGMLLSDVRMLFTKKIFFSPFSTVTQALVGHVP